MTMLTLLGVAPAETAAAQRAAMAAIAGPRLRLIACGEVCAILQDSPGTILSRSVTQQARRAGRRKSLPPALSPATGRGAGGDLGHSVGEAGANEAPCRQRPDSMPWAQGEPAAAGNAENRGVSGSEMALSVPAGHIALGQGGEAGRLRGDADTGAAQSPVRPLAEQLRSPKARAALLSLQRRLEQACLNGPFLPADPAAATASAEALQRALENEAAALAVALRDSGRYVQWDLVLSWPAEEVLALHREALLARARGTAREGGDGGEAGAAALPAPGKAEGPLSKAVLANAIAATLADIRESRAAAVKAVLNPLCRAMLPLQAGECGVGFTLLLPKDGERQVELALAALPDSVTEAASADLKGPLPPLAFTPVRLAVNSAETVREAWDRFGLAQSSDAPGLTAAWRRLVPGLHPDHGAPDGDALQAAGAAYRLLRGLLPRAGTATLGETQKRAALRLLVPSPEVGP